MERLGGGRAGDGGPALCAPSPDYGLHLAGHRESEPPPLGKGSSLCSGVGTPPLLSFECTSCLVDLGSQTKNETLTLGSEGQSSSHLVTRNSGNPFLSQLCCSVYEGGMDRKRHGKSCKMGIINRNLHSLGFIVLL